MALQALQLYSQSSAGLVNWLAGTPYYVHILDLLWA